MSESFEDARVSAQAMIYDCDIPLLDRMKRAHDHEIEQMRKASFHEGYVAGQRSMDAEHRAVAMRLQGLRFDGNHHANLSKLAYAIYPCATGWTCESCDGLRDKIIELLGGVHDEPVPVGEPSDAGCSDCHRCDGESGRVSYDVLGNERHKAVCELRKLRTSYDGGEDDLWKWLEELYAAIGDSPLYLCSMGNIKNRLIHLLGGDEPTLREIATELSQAIVDAMRRRAESDEGGEATITDELRECIETATKSYDNTPWHEMGEESEADHTICYITEGELLRIADRIDEWRKLAPEVAILANEAGQ